MPCQGLVLPAHPGVAQGEPPPKSVVRGMSGSVVASSTTPPCGLSRHL